MTLKMSLKELQKIVHYMGDVSDQKAVWAEVVALGLPMVKPAQDDFDGWINVTQKLIECRRYHRDNLRYWVTGDGEKILVRDMSNNHLRNAIAYSENNGLDGPRVNFLREELDKRPTTKRKKKMFNNKMKNKMLDRFFRRVDNVVWDLMTGTIGVQTSEGIVTFTPAVEEEVDGKTVVKEEASININMMDEFGMEVPAFAQNTPVNDLAVGDLIVGSKRILGWIVAKKTKKFELLKPDGTSGSWVPPKVTTLGFDAGGAMVLRSLMSTVGGSDNLNGLQSSLMPLMMMGGMEDLEDIMPMMMFSQMNGGTGGTNNMMQTMLMMKMMGGGDGLFSKRDRPNNRRESPNRFDR